VAYLRQASDLMRAEVLPSLESLTESVDARVAASYESSETAGALLWLIGLAAVVVLVGAAAWLAQRTRRWLSLPLVIAIGVVVAGTVIAGGAMLYAEAQATDVRDGAYARSAQLSQARVDAFDAKSNESLGLINRGSGKTFEEGPGGFDELMQSAQDVLPAEPDALPASLAGYDAVHTDIRALDDAGNWDGAVDLAVTDAPEGSNAAFGEFDQLSEDQLLAATEQVDDDLSTARQPLGVTRLLLVVAGIVAAMAAWEAFAVRLREYQ
jgi:uncharacterized integral membrane protein